MAPRPPVRRYRDYWADERRAARMYRALAELTQGERAEALRELAAIEDRHAAHWASLLEAAGEPLPAEPDLAPDEADVLARARALSLDAVLPDLEAAERAAQDVYDGEPDAAAGMADDERVHERVLARLRGQAPTPEETRAVLTREEPWHRGDRSGSLRAAVFGVSDGLVSNTALVMGFAGTGTGTGTVAFAGFAGLLAGAFSMAAGEYVSVASQRDLYQREIEMEAAELRDNPLEEQRELELLYRAKGLDADTAREAAASIMADPDTALDTLAREELGLDPSELGSPTRAAASSFAAFAVGAAVPLVPYLLATGTAALVTAIVLAVIAMVLVGGTVGVLSGRGPVRGAVRQVAVGSLAAGVTFLVGSLVGSAVG
jgi:VIT1/CCC1 family predicted Fe2+/Mn2+ transporter